MQAIDVDELMSDPSDATQPYDSGVDSDEDMEEIDLTQDPPPIGILPPNPYLFKPNGDTDSDVEDPLEVGH